MLPKCCRPEAEYEYDFLATNTFRIFKEMLKLNSSKTDEKSVEILWDYRSVGGDGGETALSTML